MTLGAAGLITFAFRSSEVKRLLLDLDPYGGTDPLGMFSLFLKRTADVLAWRLNVVFRRLLRLGSFPACWRQANVTPIPKGPSSSSAANYRPISITPEQSKMFERRWRFVSDGLWNTVVCLSERFLYLWCVFVCVTYTAECIGEREGGQDFADRLQRCFL